MIKRRLGLSAVVLTLAASGVAAFSYGCSDDDPATTPATTDSGTTGDSAAEAASQTDPANCGHCVNTLSDRCRNKVPLCQYNQTSYGKSSAQHAAEAAQCTCQGGCATECAASVCAGQQPDPACLSCLFTKCGPESQGCVADMNPNDDDCNNYAGTPTDAGSDG